MGLIFKRPFTRQPQGVVQLDRSNPLTEAPGFVWVPQRNREIVSQLPWSKSGSTPPVISATPQGVSTLHTAGAAAVSYVDLGALAGPAADIGLNSPATYVGVFYASAASGVAIAERNDGNSVDAGWVFGYIDGSNASNFGLGFLHENSSSNVSKSISNAVAPGLNVLIATYDGTQFASGINVYLNGVLGTVNGTQAGGGTTGSDASRNLYVGRNTFQTSHSHSGTILLAAAFRRLWSPAEIKQFSSNPWQIFAPSSRRLLLDVPASGTTVALTGVSATGSVGTVGVTVSKAVTGNTGTGSPGTVVPSVSVSLAGNTGTGSVGTVSAVSGLSGVTGTGSVGTVKAAIDKALTGTTGTGSVGAVSPALVAALTAVSGTGSVGSVGVNVAIGLTGTTGTGSVGTVSVAGSGAVAITGVTGTGSVGTVSPAVVVGLTGVSGTGSPGTVSTALSKALTGNSATGSVGTVGVSISKALSGNTATGTPGTVTASQSGGTITVGLSGVSAFCSVGTLGAPSGSRFGGVPKKEHLPRMTWPDKPREPKIVRHNPARSEITPDVHRSNILSVIKAARSKPRVVRMDDEDDDDWMLLS